MYAAVVGWSWSLVMLVLLDALHVGTIVFMVWPLSGKMLPSWLKAGRVALVLSLVPMQILCAGLCPIVWLQQVIRGRGHSGWFTQPFIYRWMVAVSPWEVSEGWVSAGVLVGEGVLVASVVVRRLVRGEG